LNLSPATITKIPVPIWRAHEAIPSTMD